MKVLVTGAAGFAGWHVVQHLLEVTDWEIVALRRGDPWPDNNPRIVHVSHDLRAPFDAETTRLIGVTDAVINLASVSDVPTFLNEPVEATLTNVSSTVHLLEWARRQPLAAFIQVSTNEVYGPAPADGPGHGESAALHPSTPYSGSKAAQEVIADSWRQTFDIPVTIVNTMHLFGPGQPPQRFIPTVVRQVLAGETVNLYGRLYDGHGLWRSARRNWTYVRDFADVLRWLIALEQPDARRWNVAGPEISCRDMVVRIAEFLGRDMPEINWRHVDAARPGYELRYALDTSQLDNAGYVPPFGFTLGLARTLSELQIGTI